MQFGGLWFVELTMGLLYVFSIVFLFHSTLCYVQCSPKVLNQQVRHNSWPVLFKTTYIVLVNLQEVAGGKKFLELLLEAVNFTGYRLIRRTQYVWQKLHQSKMKTWLVFTQGRNLGAQSTHSNKSFKISGPNLVRNRKRFEKNMKTCE